MAELAVIRRLRSEHVVGVFAGVGAAVVKGCQRLTLHFVDEAARNRAADKATGDEAKGGAGDADVGCVGQADFFEVGPPACRSAVSAGHGDGAGDETQQRVLVQRDGKPDTDSVLDGDKDADDDGEDDQRHAACFQAGEVRAQADGGEEHQHEGFAQRFVEGEADVVKEVERVDDDCGDQAAGDGFGDVEVLQEAVFPHKIAAKEQDDGGDNQRVVAVDLPGRDFWCLHGVTSLSKGVVLSAARRGFSAPSRVPAGSRGCGPRAGNTSTGLISVKLPFMLGQKKRPQGGRCS